MLLLGCKPFNRNTEQHDTFFAAGNSLGALVPQIKNFWPDGGKIHIDAWRKVTRVNGHSIQLMPGQATPGIQALKLFFLNLGGYKPGEFDEFHYKLLVVAPDKGAAVKLAKQTAFYKHMGFKGAASHIDEKYGVDVDDIYQIEEILPATIKDKFHVQVDKPETAGTEDEIHLGYFQLHTL